MKLTKGITGFWSGNDKPHMIKAYEIHHLLSGISYPYIVQKKEIKPPGQSSNYWRIKITTASHDPNFDLLINNTCWCCSIIESSGEWMNLKFIDFPENLKKQFLHQNPELVCLSKEFLYKKVQEEDLSDLAEVELDQINYWKSRTFGEIIFNGYD